MSTEELGKLLRKLRGKESLRSASRRSGVSYTYINILENNYDPRSKGPLKPSPDTLKLLATAYNYPYEEFMRILGHTTTEDEKYLRLAKRLMEAEEKGSNVELTDFHGFTIYLDGEPIPEAHRKIVIELLRTLAKQMPQLPDKPE